MIKISIIYIKPSNILFKHLNESFKCLIIVIIILIIEIITSNYRFKILTISFKKSNINIKISNSWIEYLGILLNLLSKSEGRKSNQVRYITKKAAYSFWFNSRTLKAFCMQRALSI